MIDGKELKIGEKVLVVPSLSIKQVRSLLPKMQTLQLGSFAEKDMDVCIEIIRMALSRNYPDITVDEIEDSVDMTNMVPIVKAVMNLSGMDEKPAGELEAGNQ